jgi:thiosulfate/3-mercaptopyruvate sulfurtransferase
MAVAEHGFLVDCDWLADQLGESDLRVLDVTGVWTPELANSARAHYDAGHIPSAVWFDIASSDGVLSEPGGELPWTWPSPGHFANVMDRHGITNQSTVVLVARTPDPRRDSGTMWCTRGWWLMHHYGVDCTILDGGVEQWVADGRPLTTDVPELSATSSFQVASDWRRAFADKNDVLDALRSTSNAVVYAGPAEVFNGTTKVAGRPAWGARNGHITGSSNVPMRSLLVDGLTARFHEERLLRQQLADAVLLKADKVITYCGGGIAATVDAFALKLCGQSNVALYDGSLTEWSADPSLPMTDPSETSAS